MKLGGLNPLCPMLIRGQRKRKCFAIRKTARRVVSLCARSVLRVGEDRACAMARSGLTADQPDSLSSAHVKLIIGVDCARVVRQISGSGIRKAVLTRIRIMNDKGRYRQLRARSQSSGFSGHNRLQNIRNLGSSARMSRFGTEFDPLKKGAWDC